VDRAAAIAALRASACDLVPGQRVEAGAFRPEDAPGVGRLFLQIYGEDYPVDDPYVPELLVEANRSGRIHTIVARAADGSVVGQAGIYQSSPPNRRMYEYGQMLVDKAYRNSFAAFRMHKHAEQNMFGKLPGVDALFGEAVCHHLVTQKMSRGVDFFECGLEVGLMPEAAYAGEGVTGRVSCLLHVRVDNDRQGDLFVPDCWDGQVRSILPAWPLKRSLKRGAAGHVPAQDAGTDMAVQQFGFAGVTRCNVAELGASFAERAAQEIGESEALGHDLIQFYLPMGSPSCGFAAEVLRQAGCFFGGIAPLWFGSAGQGPDALLAQRFLRPVALAPIKTFSEAGAAVVRLVLQDMERAGREFGAPVGVLAQQA
jgi:hypothetical protein